MPRTTVQYSKITSPAGSSFKRGVVGVDRLDHNRGLIGVDRLDHNRGLRQCLRFLFDPLTPLF